MAEQSRLDVLEGRVEQQSRNWDRVYAQIGRVDEKIDQVDHRINQVDHRIDQVDHRIDDVAGDLSSRILALDDKLSARIDALDQKLDRKIDDLRAELSKQFRWTMGTMITLLGTMLTLGAGVIAALLARPAL